MQMVWCEHKIGSWQWRQSRRGGEFYGTSEQEGGVSWFKGEEVKKFFFHSKVNPKPQMNVKKGSLLFFSMEIFLAGDESLKSLLFLSKTFAKLLFNLSFLMSIFWWLLQHRKTIEIIDVTYHIWNLNTVENRSMRSFFWVWSRKVITISRMKPVIFT